MNPGMTAERVLALFQVATGTAPPDAQGLGRITLALGRRTAAPLERLSAATAGPAAAAEKPGSTGGPAAPAADALAWKSPSTPFQPGALPPAGASEHAVASLLSAP